MLLSLTRVTRTSPGAVAAYRYVAQTVLPAVFLIASGLAVLALGHRATFDLLSTGGEFCEATKAVREQSDSRLAQGATSAPNGGAGADERVGTAKKPFAINSMCHATGLRLVAGRKYRIRLDMEGGPDGEWFDQGRRADVAGFAADSWRQAEPLPVVDFKACRPPGKPHPPMSGTIEDIQTPATADFKNEQLLCDQSAGRRPNQTLISDITANATGELFLYVNDAVLMLPNLTRIFYGNNSGTAKVTVARIMAEEIIPPPPEESVQERLQDDSAKRGERPRNN